MKEFTLELLFKISVGAASGLQLIGSQLYVVSDNSGFLYNYDVASTSIDKLALIENAREIIPKPEKPDFEAMTEDAGTVYIFGSGSTSKRNVCIEFLPDERKVKRMDIGDLYRQMKVKSGIADDQFNIEGAAILDSRLLLFQRGNGTKGQNGIFVLDKNVLQKGQTRNVKYNPVELPKINGFPSSFTDAVSVGSEIYFLATAENSASTYLDGDVQGSIIGKLDLNTFSVVESMVIGKEKFEGITLYESTTEHIKFLICEDNDSDESEAGIFLLTIQK